MRDFKRNERIGGLIKILSDSPNKVFGLNYFCELFSAAKSTISEDIVVAKRVIDKMGLGSVITISGALGGVKLLPRMDDAEVDSLKELLKTRLIDSSRILPGGYLYTADIFFDAHLVDLLGRYFASRYSDQDIDYIVTVETKGVPLALMVARYLGVPMAVVRKENKVTDGATLSINYMSVSSKMKTMSLSTRSLKQGSRVLIVDDFMKAGGTMKAVLNLLQEFNTQVVGIAVALETSEPQQKLINNYISAIKIVSINEHNGDIMVV